LAALGNLFYLPGFYQIATDTLSSVASQYPSDLVLTLKDNRLSAQGAAVPLNLTLPVTSGRIANAVVIDPSAAAEDSRNQTTLLLVTGSALAVTNPGLDSPSIFTWDQLADQPVTLTASQIQSFLSEAKQLLSALYSWRWFIVPLSLFLFIYPMRLIALLLDSLLLSLTASLLRRPLGYQKTLKLTLYTLVPAEIISLVTRLIYPDISVPIFPLAFFGISLLALLSLK
jgi:hypothetical protein